MPPLLPGVGAPGVGQKKRRVRSFFWKMIPEEQVKGRANLWTQGGVRQQYQIDVRTVEELFGQSEGRTGGAAPPGRGPKARGSFRDARDEVSILDAKRGMNLGIFLKQFRRPNQTIIDDLRHGNSEAFGAEPLRELLKLLPEAEEVARLRSYRGDAARLPLADSFMHALVQLPSFRLRVESMLLKEEFPAAAEALRSDVHILRSAAKELMNCEELHAVLHLVLQAGNILNAGSYAGGALGFQLSSLLSLSDTKANKPGMNLLHFVALEAQKKDQKLLDFPVKLRLVPAASRISVETLDAELQLLTSRTRSVEDSVRGDGELLLQLDHFLQHGAAVLAALRGGRQQLQQEGTELLDFFCEDRDSFRLDGCFAVVQHFCLRFTQAVKENEEREVKEARRRRRLQELEEQKRHSWAGGEEVGGAFGLRCSSEADMSTAASHHDEAGLLVGLLAARPRPRSPMNALGRSGSLRRSRNSPSSSPGAAAERELSAFLETAAGERKVPKAAAAAPEPGACSANLSRDSASDSNQHGDGGVGVALAAPSNAAAPDRMWVETCSLVPELRGFENLSVNKVRGGDRRRGNLAMAAVDVETSDQSGTSEAPAGDGDEAAAAVWCVAGVCEANDDAPAPGEGEGEGRRPSSSASETQPANGEAAPVPISSQPVPVTHGDGTPLPASRDESRAPGPGAGARVAAPSRTAAENVRGGPAGVPTGRSMSVRTLTVSERQGLRRVVPISRTGRGAPPTAAVRPATAPSSRRSSVHKTADPKGPRSGVVPGSRAAEEKMCRSALRALSHAAARGGSASAPATPLHGAATAPPLAGFARSTAASSFRHSRSAPPPPASGSSSSSSSSTNPRRSQSVRTARDALAPPAGHGRNDSASRPSWR